MSLKAASKPCVPIWTKCCIGISNVNVNVNDNENVNVNDNLIFNI